MVAMCKFWVKMMSQRENNIRFGILVVELPEKVSLHVILGALVQR